MMALSKEREKGRLLFTLEKTDDVILSQVMTRTMNHL